MAGFSGPPVFCAGSLDFISTDFPSSSLDALESDFNSKLALMNRWNFQSSSLEARRYAAMAFDETRLQALLFGGRKASGQSLGDTQIWNAVSGAWVQVSPSSAPSARSGHALAWIGNKYLLTGGLGQETWLYDPDAQNWDSPSQPVPPPADLFLPSLAYDPDRNQALLFGGGASAEAWIFHVAASSWSSFSLSPSPAPRLGAAMAYDKTAQKFVLFGGQTPDGSQFFSDTWIFDPVAFTWTQVSPSSAPSARTEGMMVYDSLHRQAVFFGGRLDANADSAQSDMHCYHAGKNRWAPNLSTNNDSPSGRSGHSMAYDTRNHQVLVFGGRLPDSSLVNSLWQKVLRSTGSASSSAKSVSGATQLVWSTATAVFESRPEGSDVLFQVASSSDGVSFDSFRGPDGSTSSFYLSSHTPLAIWSGHQGHRHFKIRADFLSLDMPFRSRLSSLRFRYNRAPAAPVLSSPANDARVNTSSPAFQWSASADPDDALELLSYRLEVDSSTQFSSPDISSEGITSPNSLISFQSGPILPEGIWYWRVRGSDAENLAGEWSSVFRVTVDTTTPPSPVSKATATIGPANGEMDLAWTFPGDDKGAVNGGTYRIRLSTAGPLNSEAAWAAAAPSERSALFSATSGQALLTTLSGLETATSYYFGLKTQDEIGNLSALSTVNPYAMTNASPTVALLSHQSGEILTGPTVVSWSRSDPNSGDNLTLRVYLSADGGQTYPQLLAAFPSSTTFFSWDSRSVDNGTQYRLRVTATDARGLSAFSDSALDLRTDNANEPPEVSWVQSPAPGQSVAGPYTLVWSYHDPNTFQTVTFDLSISTDSGGTYTAVAAGLARTSITLDTFSFSAWWGFGTASTYRFKLTGYDSGTPALSTETVSSVFEAVTRPTGTFVLVRPLQEDYPSIFDLVFEWQKPPGLGSGVTYTLKYSTETLFISGFFQAGLSVTSSIPFRAALLPDATYYWQVSARDSSNFELLSLVEKFILARHRAKSPGKEVEAEVLSGMPAGGFLSVEDAASSHAAALVQAASAAKADRWIQPLSAPAWSVRIRDIDGNDMAASSLTASLSFVYTDGDNDGRLDAGLVPVDQIRIARLNESLSRWEPAAAQPVLNPANKTAAITVRGFSVFTLAAAASSGGRLSAVTNFPNPFAAGREATRIRYVLIQNAKVTLRIYTLLGDLVRSFEFASGDPGGLGSAGGTTNEVIWDGRNGAGELAANGMYVMEIRGDFGGTVEKQMRNLGILK